MSPKASPPEILYEDAHLIVLSKPAGMLSQGEITGEENLVDWLRAYVGRNYVGLVHRLDRNTSGAMVVAKRTKAAQRLTSSLQKGELTRTYLAWLEGSLEKPARWRHFLVKDEKRNITRVTVANGEKRTGNKEAVLSVRPLARGNLEGRPVTLVELVLETGRSHQIRAQAAHESHPLIGDAKYGGPRSALISRPALHSYHIEFPHPMGGAQAGQTMAFNAPLPEDFTRVFAAVLSRISGSNPSGIDQYLGQLLKQAGSETSQADRSRG